MAAAPEVVDRSYGVVAFRYIPGTTNNPPSCPTKENSQVLLIQQKPPTGFLKHPSYWCFPKGHPEESDSSLQVTAIRELFEETGLVITEGDFFLGHVHHFEEVYVTPVRNVGKVVRYWAVLVGSDEAHKEPKLQEAEVSDAGWYGWDEALTKITFDEGKKLFQEVIEGIKLFQEVIEAIEAMDRDDAK